MWAMYKSRRELIKRQDLQKLGKLAAACSHLWSSGSSARHGQYPRQENRASPPLPEQAGRKPLCLGCPLGPCDLLVGLLGHPLLWGILGYRLLRGPALLLMFPQRHVVGGDHPGHSSPVIEWLPKGGKKKP